VQGVGDATAEERVSGGGGGRVVKKKLLGHGLFVVDGERPLPFVGISIAAFGAWRAQAEDRQVRELCRVFYRSFERVFLYHFSFLNELLIMMICHFCQSLFSFLSLFFYPLSLSIMYLFLSLRFM